MPAFSVHGAVAANDGRFVRFAPATARAFAHRFLDAGFVPRGGDSFALHDVERAATFVREVVGEWDDVDVILDDSLTAVASGEGAMNVSISARPARTRRRARLVRTQRRRVRRRRQRAHAEGTRRAACNPADATPKYAANSSTSRRCAYGARCWRNSTIGAAPAWRHWSPCTTRSTKLSATSRCREEVEILRERLRNFGGIPSTSNRRARREHAARLSAARSRLPRLSALVQVSAAFSPTKWV